MELKFFRAPDRPLARLVSDDEGETWRNATTDDQGRAGLMWDALFGFDDDARSQPWMAKYEGF